jgi:SH3 domain protein
MGSWFSKRLMLFPVLLVTTFYQQEMLAAGQQAYIKDEIIVQMRRGPGSDYRILESLKSGTSLKVLDNNVGDGYAEVQLTDGRTGYLFKRYLSDIATAKVRLKWLQSKTTKLEAENKSIKQELVGLRQNNSKAVGQNSSLTTERDQLSEELGKLRTTASNALAIERQRNDLQERLVNLERNNRHLKLDNQTLKNKSNHDWFLLGAGVLFAGIVVGLLFTRISWRKKTSSWDSF